MSAFIEPLISSLGAGTRLALPFIQSLTQIGVGDITGTAAETYVKESGIDNVRLSANRIYGIIREQGLGARRQDVLAAVRYFRGVQETRPYIKSVGLDKLPNPERFPLSKAPLRSNYSYIVRVEGINAYDGKPSTQYITVRSNPLIPKRQAVDIASGYMDTAFANYPVLNATLVVEDILKNSAGIIPV